MVLLINYRVKVLREVKLSKFLKITLRTFLFFSLGTYIWIIVEIC